MPLISLVTPRKSEKREHTRGQSSVPQGDLEKRAVIEGYCEDLARELGIQGRWNMNLKRREDFPGEQHAFGVCMGWS